MRAFLLKVSGTVESGITFYFFFVYLLLKKLVNKKYFLVKDKFNLVFLKIFFLF